ncbi:hypothetical protein M433DRAFT_155138 [Acidomyces richmondensis BFW]|nr:MAG: hypothetical protein FE78DRAFT_91781 [Acidomyces sp. 'richmondensis']KYG44880.1 hypothetical protein M433DRAFT_155138 [Acidomyces richmondensis BFW]
MHAAAPLSTVCTPPAHRHPHRSRLRMPMNLPHDSTSSETCPSHPPLAHTIGREPADQDCDGDRSGDRSGPGPSPSPGQQPARPNRSGPDAALGPVFCPSCTYPPPTWRAWADGAVYCRPSITHHATGGRRGARHLL